MQVQRASMPVRCSVLHRERRGRRAGERDVRVAVGERGRRVRGAGAGSRAGALTVLS